MLRFLPIGLLAVLAATAQARPVREVAPDEMESMAGAVCNGVVLSVEKTGVQRDVSFPEVSPPVFHWAQMKARVKLLHAFKGQVPAEFELFFEVLDSAKYSQPIGDGPMRIYLQKGARYRFFLKPDNGQYVGVLDGSLDDSFAVEPLLPREADDAPYLKQSEVIQIARDYISKQTPDHKAEGSVQAWCNGATWSVILHEGTSARTPYCAISVRADRTVDAEYSKLWDLPQ